MKRLTAALLAVVVMGAGCGSKHGRLLAPEPTPTVRVVSGTVLYPGGEPVPYARVHTDPDVWLHADSGGRFMLVATDPGTGLLISARDGFEPGRVYVVTHFGSVLVGGREVAVHQDIVLDQSGPI